jgi:hypothetical protein
MDLKLSRATTARLPKEIWSISSAVVRPRRTEADGSPES